MDQVEKDQVEKVTFSPDGKRAVGVNNDGDRFTSDIPNDPNLLSFLVQHKVEINVAPINANGGTGTDASAALVLPESETERLIQTFIVPGILTSFIFLYPTYKLLFPTKEEREKVKNKTRTGGGRGGAGRGGGGGLFGGRGGGGGGRGPGGMDPEAFAKSKAKIDLTPVTNTNFADVAGCDSGTCVFVFCLHACMYVFITYYYLFSNKFLCNLIISIRFVAYFSYISLVSCIYIYSSLLLPHTYIDLSLNLLTHPSTPPQTITINKKITE